MNLIDFKPITLADREKIQAFTLNSSSQICDLAFSNLYGWGERYDTSWAIVENCLLIRFRPEGSMHPAYLTPICAGDDTFAVIMDLLEGISRDAQAPLVLMGLTPACREAMERLCSNSFAFGQDEGSRDYIYLREKLVSLSGKSLQSKRNHINKFEKLYPEWSYETINEHNLQECLDLERAWLKGEEHLDASRLDEQKMIERCLSHRDTLGLQTGALRVEGKIIAFSFGSPINRDTYGVHVEKADTAYEGAFAMINREFASRIPSHYTYVNREEDLGIEGLRRSKQSYKPILLLGKDTATLIGQ